MVDNVLMVMVLVNMVWKFIKRTTWNFPHCNFTTFSFNACLCFQHGQSLSHATQLTSWLDFMPSHSPTLQCAFWPIPLPMSCTGGTRRWGLLQSCTNCTHSLYCLHIGLLIVLTVVLISQALSHCERITDNGIRHLTSGACSETLQVLELDNCPLITDNALELLRWPVTWSVQITLLVPRLLSTCCSIWKLEKKGPWGY